MTVAPTPSLLTIPCELRNTIYQHIFSPDSASNARAAYQTHTPNALASALKLELQLDAESSQCSPDRLAVLQTCKQIHAEAHLLALSLTRFDISGINSHPEYFGSLTAHVRDSKMTAIRHVTLTARISHLRALNEAWHGLPFGCASLYLDTLTVVPTKPEVHMSAYAEVADLSQSHTLAYIFAETFKRLRNVRVVEVRNRGCFNAVVWRLVYRSLVYRMWRWGGDTCGVRFLCCGADAVRGDEWFRIWPGDGEEGWEVGEEVRKLVGGNGQTPDPNLLGF